MKSTEERRNLGAYKANQNQKIIDSFMESVRVLSSIKHRCLH